MSAPTITCSALSEEGLLIRLVDRSLAEPELSAVLHHVGNCADCLLLLAQVLEIHGRVVIDNYWDQSRRLDPALSLGHA